MNVVVYVVDSLRSDHLSCYGHSRTTTPNLDALAGDGLRYERCYTPSTWTRPVSVSLLTGAYPPAHGVRRRDDAFPADLERLPGLLRERGVRTVGVSAMGNVSSTLGYDVGFDSFADLYKEEAIVAKRRRASTEVEQLDHEARETIALPRSADVVDRVLEAFEAGNEDCGDDEEGVATGESDGAGLFAFCWSIDPHLPFDPPEGFREYVDPDYAGPIDGSFESLPDDPSTADLDHLRNLYDGEVRYVDEQIGRLVERLQSLGAYEDTLLIVLGDHGEAFYEHDVVFHGTVPYEELLHVPLIVKPPAGRTPPETVSGVVSLVDVVPTVLDALGIEDRLPLSQGRLLPPFGERRPGRAVFSETQLRDFEAGHRSVSTGRWKYVRTETPPPGFVLRRLLEERESIPGYRYALATVRDSVLATADGGVEEYLYDVEADPAERSNLVDERRAVADRLRGELEEWLLACDRHRSVGHGAESAEIDAGTAEQLKQLGYTE